MRAVFFHILLWRRHVMSDFEECTVHSIVGVAYLDAIGDCHLI